MSGRREIVVLPALTMLVVPASERSACVFSPK